MKKCKNCNALIRDDDKYCRNCGIYITSNFYTLFSTIISIIIFIGIVFFVIVFILSYTME